MITYDSVGKPPNWGIPVRLDGKIVGEIRSYANGYGYVPKGRRKPADIVGTIAEVKRIIDGGATGR